MTQHPRTYEGRLLPKQDEELVDQGLQFDLGTLSRRTALRVLGIGGGSLALAACARSTSAPATTSTTDAGSATTSTSTSSVTGLTEIPDETAGPYPGDGSNGADVLEQSGVVRSDLTTSFGSSTTRAEGVPMTLELTITDLASSGDPFEGVAVYVWHCDREGRYSMYSEGVEEENYLRGVQIAGADGVVTFTSIFPACYDGRWPHIHFEVYPDEASITDASKAIATSQVAPAEGRLRDGLRDHRVRGVGEQPLARRPVLRQRLRRRRRPVPARHDHRRRHRGLHRALDRARRHPHRADRRRRPRRGPRSSALTRVRR